MSNDINRMAQLSKKSGDTMPPEEVDFRFRIRTDTNTVEGILLNYVRSGYHPSFLAKEMILRALKAFWLPFAYGDRQDLQVSSAFLKRLAQEAVSSLKQQIRDIEQSFDLESDVNVPYGLTTLTIPFVPYPVQSPVERVPTADTTSANNFEPAASPSKSVASGEASKSLELEEFVCSIDEYELGKLVEWRGQLFSNPNQGFPKTGIV